MTKHLQTGAVDDLEVDDELAATVVDDEGTDGATAVGKGIADALEQTTLGDDGKTLLDITGLGHGDEAAVVTEVQDAVGLVDGAEHGLDNHGGGGVGDEARLLLQLAGEEVHAQVAVLAGLGRDGDPDDLAGAALEDEDVTDADEVAGDRDGLAGGAAVAGLDDADLLADALAEAGGATLIAHNDVLAVVVVVEGVHDAVGGTLDAAAERVVVTLVVVVAHLARFGDGGLDLATGEAVALVCDGGLGLVGAVVRDVDGLGRLVLVGVYGLLVATVVGDVGFVGGRGSATVLSLSDVELVLDGLVVDLGTFLVADGGSLVVGVAKEKEKKEESVWRVQRRKHINKNTRARHRSLGEVDPGVTRNLVSGAKSGPDMKPLEQIACLVGTPQWRDSMLETKQKTQTNVPFTSQINLGSVVARRTIFLDTKIDFFLSVDTRVRDRRSSIFPFDARSAIELNFSLYSRVSSFRDSVTPVRRREDTEGDGDAGVKVQID